MKNYQKEHLQELVNTYIPDFKILEITNDFNIVLWNGHQTILRKWFGQKVYVDFFTIIKDYLIPTLIKKTVLDKAVKDSILSEFVNSDKVDRNKIISTLFVAHLGVMQPSYAVLINDTVLVIDNKSITVKESPPKFKHSINLPPEEGRAIAEAFAKAYDKVIVD